ncbi:GDSL-type esterase/lipase family protein [uncultured Limosilactobacillus sp.]|uniref:GDSL-type esterase/lipase family protein n=1 Tax=uncultured Limosilactobacillus sp. TaxID=2837629 RepID=UPI0025F88147|nr:GDSL-type esterase/lipase family protein [uncultured Limosilactobacillus sp.]
MKLSPQEILTAVQPTGRWFVHKQSLMTPLLGASLNFTIENCQNLMIHTVNNANPLSPSQIFTCRVDNGPWQRWPATNHKFQLSLSPANHQVSIMTGGNCDLDNVWTQNQCFTITGIIVNDQAIIKPLTKNQQILVLGDSITAGCWVNGKHASVDYRPESNYLAVAQDQLPKIEIHRIAYSAAGVLRPGTGSVPAALSWLNHTNHKLIAPAKHFDWVLIALGVNDRRFSAQRFYKAYLNYVRAVQNRYQCPVALMIPFLQSFSSEITQIGKTMNIPVITTKHWCPSTIDGLHPDSFGSLAAGQHFAQAIRQLVQ